MTVQILMRTSLRPGRSDNLIIATVLANDLRKEISSFLGEIGKANAKTIALQNVSNDAGKKQRFARGRGKYERDRFALGYAGYRIDVASAQTYVADTGLALSRGKFQHGFAQILLPLVISFFGVYWHFELYGVISRHVFIFYFSWPSLPVIARANAQGPLILS